jgi:dihydrofolate synthase/folylpolyglutamate synthase
VEIALQEYQERLDYLYSRLNYERVGMPRLPAELRLSRMRRLLRRLGDPHLSLPVIHVAGTKGKGSTAAMMASALQSAGVRTGLYCSPHLHRLEERFTIDGAPASPLEVVGLVDEVRECGEELEQNDPRLANRGATFFELTTAMGLLHFARRKVGAVVLEVGVGGRLDSTNVVHPALSIITSISFDHTKQLGNTLGLIAREKAGILKRNRPAVSGVVGQEAQEVIRAVARQRHCRLHELGTDFSHEYLPPIPPLSSPTKGKVKARTWRTDWDTLTLPLLGSHQAHNAAVALAGLDLLADVHPHLAVSRSDVVQGFARLRWPARVEVVSERPCLVIDGAHNPASAAALAETLETCFPPMRRTLVFGTTRDKDVEGQLRPLLHLFDVVIATRYLENPRSVPPEQIFALVTRACDATLWTAADPREALAIAREATSDDGLICVTGSLFLAAEARAIVMPQLAMPSRAIIGMAR